MTHYFPYTVTGARWDNTNITIGAIHDPDNTLYVSVAEYDNIAGVTLTPDQAIDFAQQLELRARDMKQRKPHAKTNKTV